MFDNCAVARLTIAWFSLNRLLPGDHRFESGHLCTKLVQLRQQLCFSLSSPSHRAYPFFVQYGGRTDDSSVFLARGTNLPRFSGRHYQNDEWELDIVLGE
jgi:hypothetical protein